MRSTVPNAGLVNLRPLDPAALERTAAAKYGSPPDGWRPAIRDQFGYYTPDDVYESVVDRLVKPGCRWLDVGCGRNVFPWNPSLAEGLSKRCSTLVGVDPDPTIQQNPTVQVRVQKRLEEFEPGEGFDVITARMVIEHVPDPVAFASNLKRLTAPHGVVVLYTVNKWSPVSIASWLVPFALHSRLISFFWGTGREAFPVEYRMNTRRALTRVMREQDFEERSFEYLDDCRTLSRFRWGSRAELLLWKIFKAVGLHYPETCLLGVYQRLVR